MGSEAETGFKGYQYNHLQDNFKVIVVNFKSFCKKYMNPPGSKIR